MCKQISFRAAPLVYFQLLHKDLLFAPFLAGAKVLCSNITLRFTVPGRAQMKMRQHPYGSSFSGVFFFFFFYKETYYITQSVYINFGNGN